MVEVVTVKRSRLEKQFIRAPSDGFGCRNGVGAVLRELFLQPGARAAPRSGGGGCRGR